MTSDSSILTLPFVGPKYQQLLKNLGIVTVGDLLYHLPSRYVDLSKITPIEDLVDDELQVIQATVESAKKVRLKGGGRIMITAQVSDDTSGLQLTWFNQPYIEQSLKVGQVYRFAGEAEYKFNKLQMVSPTFELASKPMVHTGRIVAIYPQTAGITSKWLRARTAPLLSKLETLTPEWLPAEVIARQQLLDLPQAIKNIHTPRNFEEAQQAKKRLGFDELLLLQLSALQRQQATQQGPQAHSMSVAQAQIELWIKALPFELTQAQSQALAEILQDISQTAPMNRLLEGDVGSGKTVVATMAALAAVETGFQVAFMAPTSVLAQQHYQTLQKLIEACRLGTTISLRTSKSKSEPADITVGTHALIAQGIEFQNLGLVIIDEQHRFGVEQRAELMAKTGGGVHVLSMTATPIPRTLTLTAFADLSVSIIDQLPSDRLPVKTHVVPETKRADMEGFLEQAMQRGEQVYVICPLIEQSDSLAEVRAVTVEFERLQKVFSHRRLSLLHGRLKTADKDAILDQFKDHQIDCLVATSVVEVGIDVPNATILVIEGAERFGLAQLHQLRGRVGRGALQSYCFLLSDAKNPKDIARLQHLVHETSGFKLAELDLATRGPGEVFGLRQSGIPELKAADFMDIELTKAARDEAELLIQQPLNPVIQARVDEQQKHLAMN